MFQRKLRLLFFFLSFWYPSEWWKLKPSVKKCIKCGVQKRGTGWFRPCGINQKHHIVEGFVLEVKLEGPVNNKTDVARRFFFFPEWNGWSLQHFLLTSIHEIEITWACEHPQVCNSYNLVKSPHQVHSMVQFTRPNWVVETDCSNRVYTGSQLSVSGYVPHLSVSYVLYIYLEASSLLCCKYIR